MIHLRTPHEIKVMREGGRLAAGALDVIGRRVRPGCTTRELEDAAEDHLRAVGAEAAFKGYRGYPGSICVSVNVFIRRRDPLSSKVSPQTKATSTL